MRAQPLPQLSLLSPESAGRLNFLLEKKDLKQEHPHVPTLRKFWRRGSLGTLDLAVFPAPGPRDRELAPLRPQTTCSARRPAGLRASEGERDPPLSLYTGVIFNPAFQNITELPLSDAQEALLGRVSC